MISSADNGGKQGGVLVDWLAGLKGLATQLRGTDILPNWMCRDERDDKSSLEGMVMFR